MLDNSFLKKFDDLNASLNNTNTFLLDISLPLINYLLTKNNDFEEMLGQACRNNRRFASKTLEPALLEKTDDLLLCISYASDYVDCQCHNKSWTEFQQEIAEPLREYCLFLVHFVDESDFKTKLATASAAFGHDYTAIKSDFMENRLECAQAEKAVLYWQGAIPDIVMQEAILKIRYDYLKKLLQL